MRLGGYFGAETVSALPAVLPQLDKYGLSAIRAPSRLPTMSLDEAAGFGEVAAGFDVAIGEWPYWQNILTRDPALQEMRLTELRDALVRADEMRCASVVTMIGSYDPSDSPLAPHPELRGDSCRADAREFILKVLDGLDLRSTSLSIEPWATSFFHQPDEILAFLDDVDHPRLLVHLDLANMLTVKGFFESSAILDRTLELLDDRIAAVHLKDVAWDFSHLILKWDEVLIGDGIVDYGHLLSRIAGLPRDVSCYCEHLDGEAAYADNFSRVHAIATRAGVSFARRSSANTPLAS